MFEGPGWANPGVVTVKRWPVMKGSEFVFTCIKEVYHRYMSALFRMGWEFKRVRWVRYAFSDR